MFNHIGLLKCHRRTTYSSLRNTHAVPHPFFIIVWILFIANRILNRFWGLYCCILPLSVRLCPSSLSVLNYQLFLLNIIPNVLESKEKIITLNKRQTITSSPDVLNWQFKLFYRSWRSNYCTLKYETYSRMFKSARTIELIIKQCCNARIFMITISSKIQHHRLMPIILNTLIIMEG